MNHLNYVFLLQQFLFVMAVQQPTEQEESADSQQEGDALSQPPVHTPSLPAVPRLLVRLV